MVQPVIDPIRVPVLNLSGEEIAEIEEQMAADLLPKDFLRRHFDAVQKNVFGQDVKHDRSGNPIEQGLGSEFGMTRNSINAYKKYCSNEPDFEKNVARMEKQLAAANERRKQAAAR